MCVLTSVRVCIYRCVMDAAEHGEAVHEQRRMRVHVRAGTYRLMYGEGGEDVLWRGRRAEDEAALQRRARGRQEEQRRWLGRQMQGAWESASMYSV